MFAIGRVCSGRNAQIIVICLALALICVLGVVGSAQDEGTSEDSTPLGITQPDLIIQTMSAVQEGVPIHICADLAVSGDLTANDNLIVAKNLNVAGEGTISGVLGVVGNLVANSDLTVGKNFYVAEEGTISGVLGVGGNLVANSDLTVGKNFYVAEEGTISGVLGVGGNLVANSDLTVGKNFYVAGEGTISGVLGVGGNLVANSNLSVAGNTTIGGTLGVTGATTLSTLTVAGASTLTGKVTTGTDLSVGRDLAVTRNTTIGGTLGVTGATTLSTLTVAGASTLTGKVTTGTDLSVGRDLAVVRNTTIGGTLNVALGSTLTGIVTTGTDLSVGRDLAVVRNTTIGGTLNVALGSTLTGIVTTGTDLTVGRDLAVVRNTTIGGTLNVALGSTLTGIVTTGTDLSVGRDLAVVRNTTIGGTLNVALGSTLTGIVTTGTDLTVGRDLAVVRNTTIGGTLNVALGSTLTGIVTTGTDLTVGRDLAVVRNTTIGGTLNVALGSTLTGIVTTGTDLTVGRDLAVVRNTTIGGTLGVALGSTLTGIVTTGTDLTVGRDLAVVRNTTIGGTLNVALGSTLTGIVTTGTDLTVGRDLAVVRNTTIGGTLGVTGATTIGVGPRLTFTVTPAANTARVSGALTVTGASTLQGKVDTQNDLDVGRNLKIQGILGAQRIEPLQVGKLITIDGGIAVAKDIVVGGVLSGLGGNPVTINAANVLGNVNIGGNIVANALQINNLVLNVLNVNQGIAAGFLHIKDNAIIDKDLEVGDELAVKGTLITQRIAALNEGQLMQLDGGITVTKDLVLGGTLSGLAGDPVTINAAKVLGNMTVAGDLSADGGVTAGFLHIKDNAIIDKDLEVGDELAVKGTLITQRIAALNEGQLMQLDGGITVTKDLVLGGTLSGLAGDPVTINAAKVLGNMTVAGDLSADGGVTAGFLHSSGNVIFDKDLEVGDELVVEGTLITQRIAALNEGQLMQLDGGITVTKDLVLGGTLSGLAGDPVTINAAKVLGNMTVAGDLSADGGVTAGFLHSSGNVIFDKDLEVGDELVVEGTLITQRIAALNEGQLMQLDGGITVTNDLVLGGVLSGAGGNPVNIDTANVATDLTVNRDVSILNDLLVANDLDVFGDLTVFGIKFFAQPHPMDSTKVITYAALEGPEAGTYVRGTAQLVDGEVMIELPESFRLVTSEEGLTAQITPLEECNGLYVVEKTPERIVVKELMSGSSNARFDYLIQGVRKGYEDFEPIRDD